MCNVPQPVVFWCYISISHKYIKRLLGFGHNFNIQRKKKNCTGTTWQAWQTLKWKFQFLYNLLWGNHDCHKWQSASKSSGFNFFFFCRTIFTISNKWTGSFPVHTAIFPRPSNDLYNNQVQLRWNAEDLKYVYISSYWMQLRLRHHINIVFFGNIVSVTKVFHTENRTCTFEPFSAKHFWWLNIWCILLQRINHLHCPNLPTTLNKSVYCV